jgi:SAM-dependent methyltransferase
MAELLIGCGNRREKLIGRAGSQLQWSALTTLDNDPDAGADIEHDLERLPLPVADESFDEIHAYHVLEHTGRQGDFRFFFDQWTDFWRILKPGGLFCGVVPSPKSDWVWGDPGHTRNFRPELLTYLNQPQYTAQVGVTAFADYRRVYKADFDLAYTEFRDDDISQGQFFFVISAVKPSRISV